MNINEPQKTTLMANYSINDFEKYIEKELKNYKEKYGLEVYKKYESEEISIQADLGHDERFFIKYTYKLENCSKKSMITVYFYYTEVCDNFNCMLKIIDKNKDLDDFTLANFLVELSLQLDYISMAVKHIQCMEL